MLFFFHYIIIIIWELFCYLFQGIPIIFWFTFSNISVYYILIINVFGLSLLSTKTNLIYIIHILFLYHPGSYSKNILSLLWMFHMGMHILPLDSYSGFNDSLSVIYLCITYLFSVSIEISLISLFSFVSFSQPNPFWCYPHVHHLHNPLSQLGICHLGIYPLRVFNYLVLLVYLVILSLPPLI